MKANLLAYDHVPPGFEVLIANKEICQGGSGGIWNLWWNITLTDDPEAWDNEIKQINAMQGRLGELAKDQRLIRAHIAEFCREASLFPESIEILCKEIGENQLSKPFKIGCEGRRLLESLEYHDSLSLKEQQKYILSKYTQALNRWVRQNRPENPLDTKILQFLGQSTKDKNSLTEQLLSIIDSELPSISQLRELCKNECRKNYGKAALEISTRPFRCFKCRELLEAESVPRCGCCYSMVLDATLLCTQKQGNHPMMDLYNHFTEEYILAYAMTINSWLQEETPQPIMSLITSTFITEDYAQAMPNRIYTYLGEKNKAKEWLATCLLKTIKDNQRWHKRTELIDGFPKTTSWLRKISSK